MMTIGFVSVITYLGNHANKFINFLSLFGSMFILMPALNWWRDYFKKLFDIE
jgi:hypothetical protein